MYVFISCSHSLKQVILPELALLRLAVYDENDKIVGQRVLPLDGIQPGITDLQLKFLFCFIF